jgi:hypothetical protein
MLVGVSDTRDFGYVGAMKLADLCRTGAACTYDCLLFLDLLSGSSCRSTTADIGPAVAVDRTSYFISLHRA